MKLQPNNYTNIALKMESIVIKNQGNTNHFVLNVGKQEVKRVPKGVFSSIVAPTLVYKTKLIKYKGCTKVQAQDLCKKIFGQWKPQFLEKMKDIWKGAVNIIELLSTLSTVSHAIQNYDFKPLLHSIIDVFWSALTVASSPGWVSMAAFVFKLWSLFNQYGSSWIPATSATFRPQGMEDIALSLGSFLLPPQCLSLVKRMQLFTNAKVLDDASSFQALFDLLYDLLSFFLDPIVTLLPQWMQDLLSNLKGMGGKYVLLREAKHLLRAFETDQKKCVDPSFILKVKVLRRKWQENANIIEYSKFSPTAKVVGEKLENMYKCILSHEEVGRQEPNCFIFEGKPGSFKTVMMNQVIKAANVPSYSHIVKTVDDGKDFYDTYRNEKIF